MGCLLDETMSEEVMALSVVNKGNNNRGSNFIEITPHNGCSPVNMLHIFKTPIPKNMSKEMLLQHAKISSF